MTTDLSRLPQFLSDLYRTVKALEEMAPGRRFTPDGHLVGSIGEAVAAYAYDLKLENASKRGFDALAPDGREVQIKLTQGQRVAISYDCAHLLVLRFDQVKGFEEIYNGPGRPVWDLVGTKASEGRQRQISLAVLKGISEQPDGRLKQVKPFPAVLAQVVEAAGAVLTASEGPEVAAPMVPRAAPSPA